MASYSGNYSTRLRLVPEIDSDEDGWVPSDRFELGERVFSSEHDTVVTVVERTSDDYVTVAERDGTESVVLAEILEALL